MTKTILAVQINPEGYVLIKYIHPYLCSHAECRRPAITLHKNKFEIHVIGAMGSLSRRGNYRDPKLRYGIKIQHKNKCM